MQGLCLYASQGEAIIERDARQRGEISSLTSTVLPLDSFTTHRKSIFLPFFPSASFPIGNHCLFTNQVKKLLWPLYPDKKPLLSHYPGNKPQLLHHPGKQQNCCHTIQVRNHCCQTIQVRNHCFHTIQVRIRCCRIIHGRSVTVSPTM